MSYTYVATTPSRFPPLAAFQRKHELERWCAFEARHGSLTGWLKLYRVFSQPWDRESRVVELEYVAGPDGGRLIEKRT